VTTGTDYYLNSIRLVGFCGVNGINWPIVTRMKESGNPPRESFHGVFPKECLPILHYMRPQFRFLIYFGRDNTRVNLADELDQFFLDMEKVVSGDASVWGAPVVVDGVHILPDVECLVPSWLRQEFFLRGHPIWTCLRISTMCFRECVVLFCCQQTIFVSILLCMYIYRLFI
jgi:hypothetical protein